MIVNKLSLFMLLFAGGRFAHGDSVARSIEIGEATFAGKGCITPEDVSVALSADGKLLNVAFKSNFVAKSAEGSTHTRVACNGVIPVEVPARRGPKLKQRFETPGAARFSVDGSPSKTIWSSCGAAQARLRINTALIAHGNASAIGLGSPANEEDGVNSLRFAISYKKCASSGNDKAEADEVDDEEQASEV